MLPNSADSILPKLADGRTDLVFDLASAGHSPETLLHDGVSLLQWCAYYGDVSAIRFLLSRGAALTSLGKNFGLIDAAFHGHWRLCQFLLEQGANPNEADLENGETPLHAALCKTDRVALDRVLEVLLAYSANPNTPTLDGVETSGFMRDVRTRGESPLHRAAAFGDEHTIQLLLNAGAIIDAKDARGESPLSWASWYLRPTPILRMLCYGNFRIRTDNQSMSANLQGTPSHDKT